MQKYSPEDELDAQLRDILQGHFARQEPPLELRASLVHKARLVSGRKRKHQRLIFLIPPAKNKVSGSA